MADQVKAVAVTLSAECVKACEAYGASVAGSDNASGLQFAAIIVPACNPGGQFNSALYDDAKAKALAAYLANLANPISGKQGVRDVYQKDVDAKPATATQVEYDLADKARRHFRAVFQGSYDRATDSLIAQKASGKDVPKVEKRAKQNAGGRSGKAKATEPTAQQTLTILPSSFVSDMRQLKERAQAFQQSAAVKRLSADGKRDLGNLCALILTMAETVEKLGGPASASEAAGRLNNQAADDKK